MIVYVVGKKRVKGVSGKNCFYIGTVQTDGYIYFADEYDYRCECPTLSEDTSVAITNAQVKYPSRNTWVKCMHFTDLTVRPFVAHNLYVRVGQNERNIVSLGDEVSNLSQQVSSLSSQVNTLQQTVDGYTAQIQELTRRTNLLLTWVNQLGNYALGDGAALAYTGNGEVLLQAINTLNSTVNVVNAQHQSTIPTLVTSVWNDWNDRSF